MVVIGDSIKDVQCWVRFRKEHLLLERQKVPFVIKEELRDRVRRKLLAKIQELEKLAQVLDHDIKSASKYEHEKVAYLRDRKIEALKEVKR